MSLERYEYQINPSFKEYEFYSLGPKGRIKKVVHFTLQSANGIPYYNLGFGDWNEEKQIINDIVITNNGDTEKVLSTVAVIVKHFSQKKLTALIYAEGSTEARTRRYQMGINKLWHEIDLVFEVHGLSEDDIWEPFEKNVKYTAFLVRRKKSLNLVK